MENDTLNSLNSFLIKHFYNIVLQRRTVPNISSSQCQCCGNRMVVTAKLCSLI